MRLTREHVIGFDPGKGRADALRHARVVAVLPDGSEMELPAATGRWLADSYRTAQRSGSTVAVAGDGDTVSAREAAEMLGVSRPTIYKWIEQGRLDEQRDTNDHRVYRASVDRILDHRQSRHDRILAELQDNPESDFSHALLEQARALRAAAEA